MTWVLTKIDASYFNTASTVIAKVISGILLMVLGLVYPQMVWTFIKRGNGVDLDGIIAPPVSFLAAARQYFRGYGQRRSGLLFLLVFIILIVAAFSHALANVFLEFVEVDVGSNQVCQFTAVSNSHYACDFFSLKCISCRHFFLVQHRVV